MGEKINNTLSVFDLEIMSWIPSFWEPLIILIVYTSLLFIYIVFVWEFYHFLAKRNILKLNLNKYNNVDHPVGNKILASSLYLLEYIILLPIFIFFWFTVLAIFLLVLSETPSVHHILLIATAVITATRIASYYNEGSAKELAKIFPLSLLAVFVSDASFFSVQGLIDRVLEIPSFLDQILIYLIFIASIEIILRAGYLLIDLITSEEMREVEEVTKENSQEVPNPNG